MNSTTVHEIERVRQALSYLSPDCDRDTWVQIGMSIKNGLGDDGFSIWNEWSALSEKYDEQDARKTWYRHIKAEGTRTIASLYWLAKKAGWKDTGDAPRLSRADAEANKEAQAAALAASARQTAERQAEAAKNAAHILADSRHVAASDRPDEYSQRKGIRTVPGTYVLREWGFPDVQIETGERLKIIEKECLVVPVRDAQGTLRSLQIIGPSGRKQFLAGGAIKGNFFEFPASPMSVSVGVMQREVILIGEGFASVASAYEATGHASVVAFNAGNLLTVATIFRQRFPEAILVFLVDNDQWEDGPNTGYRKAYEAARAVGGVLAVPPFTKNDATGEDQDGRLTGPKDWNDWSQIHGSESIKKRIQVAIYRQVTVVLAPDRQSATGVCHALRALPRGERVSGDHHVFDLSGRGPSDLVIEIYDDDLAQRAAALHTLYPRENVYILARRGEEQAALDVACFYGVRTETLSELAGGQFDNWFDALLAEVDQQGDTNPFAHAAVAGAIGRAMDRPMAGTDDDRNLVPAPAIRDENRRRQQQDENKRLQVLGVGEMIPSELTVEQMLETCVYIAEGKNMAFVTESRSLFLKIDEFRALTRSSKSEIEVIRNGNPVKKMALNADLWLSDVRREVAMTATFNPGEGNITENPKGLRAVNTWRPISRWPAKADVTPFLEQIEYLFPDPNDREAFLDWLAHIEQFPGELPHYGWLHIAENTGTGRNWMAGALARVFRGYVAPNIDLSALLDSQYNGVLAGCVLGIVDEVQEGASEGYYRHAERLKSMVNAEMREVNQKYGLKYLEHNAMRWLVLSNHKNALPLTDDDRRFRVVMHQEQPRSPEVYERLYALLKDPEFINAIGVYLRERDISGFKPGERPPLNASKLAAIAASKPMSAQTAEEIVASWPSDVITNKVLIELFTDGAESKEFTPAMRRALEEAGAQSWQHGKSQKIKIDGLAQRAWVLRNHSKWLAESIGAVRDEIARARVYGMNNRPAGLVLADAVEKMESYTSRPI